MVVPTITHRPHIESVGAGLPDRPLIPLNIFRADMESAPTAFGQRWAFASLPYFWLSEKIFSISFSGVKKYFLKICLFCAKKFRKTQYLVALKNNKNNWKICKKIIDFFGIMLYS